MLAKSDMLTAPEMRALLADMLVMVGGGSRDRWWHLIGNVGVSSSRKDGDSNWIVRCRGSVAERDLIDRAVSVAREKYFDLLR